MLASVLVLAGCSIRVPRYIHVDTPGATVTAVAVTKVSQEGARVEVTVELHNPNEHALPLRVSHYTLRIDGFGETTLRDQPPVTVPAHGSRRMVLPASLVTDGQPLQGQAYAFSGMVTYEPPGEIRRVLTDSGLPLPSASFRSDGVFE